MMAYLVVGEDEGVGNHNVFATGSRKDNDLGNIIGGKRLTSAT